MRSRLKKSNPFLIFLFLLNFTGVGVHVQGQDVGFEAFLQAGDKEAQMLMTSYLEPLITGYSFSMANGWYNTARTHEALGFDFSVTANFTLMPEAKKYFTFVSSEYRNVVLSGDDYHIPTILGPSKTGSEVKFTYTDEETGQVISNVFTPQGENIMDDTGLNSFFSPSFQMSIGTFVNTDLIVRYMPSSHINGCFKNVFGIGVKHDLKQWIPVLKDLPVDISALGNFSGFQNRCEIESQFEGENQAIEMNINNWSSQLLISGDLSMITLFAGVGYNTICSSSTMSGTYTIEDQYDTKKTFTVKDPVYIEYKKASWMTAGGFRLNFGLLSWFGSFTYQFYPVVTSGFGFSMR